MRSYLQRTGKSALHVGSQVRGPPSVGGGSPSLSSLWPVRIQVQGLWWEEGDITRTSCPPDPSFQPQYPDRPFQRRALQPVTAAL